MELMTEFHKYPDNSIGIDNINGKGCITESVAISKSGKYAYVTLICNSRGNAKKVALYKPITSIRHGEMDGEYGVAFAQIPVEKGDYIVNYAVNGEHQKLTIRQITDVQIKGVYNSYAVVERKFDKFIYTDNIDMNDINSYSRFGELAKVVKLAYQKAHDYKYELKPYCRMG